MKNKLITASLLCFIVTSCFATDINGKWTGKIMDQFDVVYTFKVDGEKLTGSTLSPEGTPIMLKDGVIKGDDLSFTMEIMSNVVKVTGKVKDDTITLAMPGMNGGDVMTVILKKEKN